MVKRPRTFADFHAEKAEVNEPATVEVKLVILIVIVSPVFLLRQRNPNFLIASLISCHLLYSGHIFTIIDTSPSPV